MNTFFKFSIIFSFLLVIFSCQDDKEICAEKATPRLVIDFFDTNTQTKKTLDSVYVSSSFLGSKPYPFGKVSRISIPLSGVTTTETLKLKLTKNATTSDNITIHYTPVERFLSKGCGFGYTYQNVSATLVTPASNVQSISQKLTTINDESQAHLYIYY